MSDIFKDNLNAFRMKGFRQGSNFPIQQTVSYPPPPPPNFENRVWSTAVLNPCLLHLQHTIADEGLILDKGIVFNPI